MKEIFLPTIIGLLFVLFNQCTSTNESESKELTNTENKIEVQWVDHLDGDFSFNKSWSYQEGIYMNQFGQLSCDGFCPEDSWRMKDSMGKIYADSLVAFYEIVDTSHLSHTIECEAWCYEYDGTNFIDCFKTDTGYSCQTWNTMSTHCSLNFTISGTGCFPKVELLSINNMVYLDPEIERTNTTFSIDSGFIKIDKSELENGIFKAEFDFQFHNHLEEQPIFWKGKILTPIADKSNY